MVNKVTLSVPYFSQRDNAENPSGSCNVTSIAMCLSYLGVEAEGNGQLEDELYRKCGSLGLSRHEATDLAYLVDTFPGIRDDYTPDGTLALIRNSLDKGSPCVIHTFLTGFGHIIAITGYDKDGFYVNDPWGEWNRDGYTASYEPSYYSNALIAASAGSWSNGQFLELYDNGMTAAQCEAMGSMWLHRIGKK